MGPYKGQRDARRSVLRAGQGHAQRGAVVVHRVTLNSVRVQDVEINNVAAVVLPAEMPFVLLGNSFLSRFSMLREDDTMRLRRKP